MIQKAQEATTTIKDPVHGYIEFPKSFVQNFIDTDLFQRLQEVSQTGMKVLYPNATHNRFCHSLGVYHLGKKSFSYFRNNVKAQFPQIYSRVVEISPNGMINSSADVIWEKWELLFVLSCLLHDCGHSPFSHSLEEVYDYSQVDVFSGITAGDSAAYYSCKYLTHVFGEKSAFASGLIRKSKPYGAPHERMSACMMISQYGKAILNVLVSLFVDTKSPPLFSEDLKNDYLQCKESLEQCTLSDGSSVNVAIKDRIFAQDLEFMVRCIIGYPYQIKISVSQEERITNQLKNCIIKLLNSQLDVDNLDYTVRDSAISGYSSATVDIERLLRSRTITVGNVVQDKKIKEKSVDGEFKLTKLTYTKDDGSFDAYLSGPLRYECTEKNESCEIFIDGIMRPNLKYCTLNENQKIHIHSEGTAFQIKPRKGYSVANVHITGRVSGLLSGQAFGEMKKDCCTLTWLDGEFPVCIEPAFHKSALSVLQGAFDANNFESLWIYSHHKTTYYNSFLVFCLLDTYCGILYERDQAKLKKVLVAKSPVSDCPTVQCCAEIKKETIIRVLHLLGASDGAVQVSAGFGWSTSDVQELEKLVENADLDTEKCRKAYDVLYAAAVARFSGVNISKHVLTEEEGEEGQVLSAYSKLRQILTNLVTPNFDISTISDDIKWVQQVAYFGCLSGDVIKVMFNVIGMIQKSTYDGKTFFRSSDYDLLSRYKELARDLEDKKTRGIELTDREKRFREIQLQLEGRNYCRSMWKSHAEYAYYVQRYSKQEIDQLNSLLIKAAAHNSPCANSQGGLPSSPYVFLSDYHCNEASDLWHELTNALQKNQDKLEILVWVPQRIKHKSYDLRNTYITWKRRTVSLAELNFHQAADNKVEFFYIYYKYGHYEYTATDGSNSRFVPAEIQPEKMLSCLIEYTRKVFGDGGAEFLR